MASSIILQPSLKHSTWIAFDRTGNPDSSNKEDLKLIADLVDKHYATWNKLALKNDPVKDIKKGVGLGALIAGFETIVASFLLYLQKSPATITNLVTTLGECVQVIIANYSETQINPERIDDPVKKSIAYEKLKADKEKRENLVAGVVTAAGGLGLWKWGQEMFGYVQGNEAEIHELPFAQKIGLSIASFLSALGMCAGHSEKCTLAPIAQNGGFRTEEMKLNGKSDGRCSVEWLIMTAFPFIVHMKPVKAFFDLILPLSALKDGLKHFYEKLKKEHNNNPEEIRTHFNFLKDLHDKFFFTEWFFGNKPGSGFRTIILKPIYELFGCSPPKCYLKNNKLMIRLPEADLKKGDILAPVVHHEEPTSHNKGSEIHTVKEVGQKSAVRV